MRRKRKISREHVHLFKIIRKTGRRTGVASWKCKFCTKRIKSM